MISSCMTFLLFFGFYVRKTNCRSFYIRHYSGSCLAYDTNRQSFVFEYRCWEKFRWKDGARLVHTASNKCFVPQSSTDGSLLTISDQCNGTNSLFQYNAQSQFIKHLLSGRCLHPETGATNPLRPTAVISQASCNHESSKYVLRHQAQFIVRHFNSLCWVYDEMDSYFKLQNTLGCDRFEYMYGKSLLHFKIGKCVSLLGNKLSLISDCTSSTTEFKFTSTSLIQHVSSKHCVHPENGSLRPSPGTRLITYPNCAGEDRLRMIPYDDRGKLRLLHDFDILDISIQAVVSVNTF